MAGMRVYVSHAGPDSAWAEWIAWQLVEAGYVVELESWDWSAGDNFVERMNRALTEAARVVALFSSAYFESQRFTIPEWTAILSTQDGSGPSLVPLRIEPVTPPPVVRSLFIRDLYGLAEDAARSTLLHAVAGARRPVQEPDFPVQISQSQGELGEPRLPGALPQVWNVPPRSVLFTGRGPVLASLRQHFRAGGGPTVVEAMHGWGGVGKTSVAIEYAYRYATFYDLVWWVDAEQPALIGDQFTTLAIEAGWVNVETITPLALAQVWRRLRTTPRWLVVFDNANSPADLHEWLPQGPGHVIITSRNPHWEQLATSISVNLFTRSDSVALLRRLAPALDSQNADLIAAQLGDLPLAVTQAGGFLAETGMDGVRYLDEMSVHVGHLMTQAVPIGYRRSLRATIGLTLSRLEEEDPAAVQLLHLCALLAPEPIPVELFDTAPVEALSQPLTVIVTSRLAMHATLGRISRYGLGKIGSGGLQVHRLTQAIIADQADDVTRKSRTKDIQAILIAAQPDAGDDPAMWPRWSQLLPHILAAERATDPDERLRHVVTAGIRYLRIRGDAHTALPIATELHQRWLNQHGSDEETVLKVGSVVAACYADLGHYAQARTIDEDTLARSRRVLGEDHPQTLASANSLAVDLRRLAEFEQARNLNADTLARSRRVLGEDHPQTLASAGSLAADLYRLGHYEQAREIDEDTLARSRRVLGEDHPQTLASANSLAADLRRLAEFEWARRMDEDTLARRRRVLGEDHPDTLRSANNLAVDLVGVGEIEEARQVDEDTLGRRRRILGEDHPESLRSANNLAGELRQLGQVEQARRLDEDTVARYRRVLGEDHPDTLRSASNLGADLRQLGQVEQARRLDEDTVARYRRVLGEDHPDTLRSASNLGADLRQLGQVEQARRLDEDTVARYRRVLGEDHPESLRSASNLAADLQSPTTGR